MTLSLHTGRRQLLKTATLSLGAVVAIAFAGMVVGALIAAGYDVSDGSVGMVGDDFGLIGGSGVVGGMGGGFVGSGVLASTAFFKGFRRKLLTITERGSGRCLNRLAALGGCSIPIFAYLMYSRTDEVALKGSAYGNVFLLIVAGCSCGIAAAIAFGLVVGLLTVVCLTVVVLVRVSAGFLHSARRSPELASADLISGACDPWPIRTAAALMPPAAGRRWRDDFKEACYDHENYQYAKLLRNFLVHAPAVVVWAWIATLQRRVLSTENSRKPRW